jgi:hypothetical protein
MHLLAIDLKNYLIVRWRVRKFINKMFKWIKNKKSKLKVEPIKKETRLEQMKKNPYKRVDSENMTDIEKMDRGFNGKTFSINGIDIDF